MSSLADRRRLLVSAARSDGPTVADRDRIRLALAARLAGGPPPDGGATASAASSAPAPGSTSAGHPQPGHASAATKGLATGPAGGLAGLIGVVGAASVAALAVAAFLTVRPIGGASDPAPAPALPTHASEAAGRDAIKSDPRRSDVDVRPAEASSPSPGPVLDLDEEPVPAPVAPSVKAASAQRSPTTTASGHHGSRASTGGLAEEVELLRRAREATRDGDGARALAVLDDLERRQPEGMLAEERRASRLVALCASDRAVEGKDAARTFLAEMPSSIHADRVRAACDLRSPR